jgi:hypothetical protein
MRKIFLLIIVLLSLTSVAQTEWHVRPYANDYTPTGDGSIDSPWNLDRALRNADNLIKPGDVVWLHGGVYRGHFWSTLQGTATKYITVKSYPSNQPWNPTGDAWAVLDGFIANPTAPVTIPTDEGYQHQAVLFVTGGFVQFESFEVSCRGNFRRLVQTNCVSAQRAHEYCGIRHDIGKNKFVNMIIRNIPGVGFASWKQTEDTEIYGNLLYYNGQLVTTAGCNVPLTAGDSGNTEGDETAIYTQNESTSIRQIKNNMFFNNYKSGIGVWSAPTSTAPDDAEEDGFLHHFNIQGNVFMNNNSPCWDSSPAMAIASNSPDNRAHDITVSDNLFYVNNHSTFMSGPWLFNSDGIEFHHNYIFNGALGFALHENNTAVSFHHNSFTGRYYALGTIASYQGTGNNEWYMGYNKYFIATWINDWNLQNYVHTTGSGWISLGQFQTAYSTTGLPVEEFSSALPANTNNEGQKTFITQNAYDPYMFYVTIYNYGENLSSIPVSFANYTIPNNMGFEVRDAQNYFVPITVPSGNTFTVGSPVTFPMNLTAFEMPLPAVGVSWVGTIPPQHSNPDFCVFIVKFQCKVPYDVVRQNLTEAVTPGSTLTTVAQHDITLGANYNAPSGSNLVYKAGHQIRFRPGTTISPGTTVGSGSTFHAKIETGSCPTILNIEPFERNDTAQSGPKTAQVEPENGLIVHPNPSSGIFSVESPNVKMKYVTVSDVNSARTYFAEAAAGLNVITVDITNAPTGVYVVSVLSEDGKLLTKNVIKK